jgi:hypothetical protein
VTRPDLRHLFRALRRSGWRVVVRSHVKVYRPDGTLAAVTSSTPSDQRGTRNFLADLRRGGFDHKEARDLG